MQEIQLEGAQILNSEQKCSDIKEDEESESRSLLSVEKPGWLGSGTSHLLLNMRDTTAMLGLSSGNGCTHNSAI